MTEGRFPCFRCGRRFETTTERTMHVIRRRCPEIETDRDVDAATRIHTMDETARATLGDEEAEKLYERHHGSDHGD